MTGGAAEAVQPAAAAPAGPPARYWALYHAVLEERGRRIKSAVLAGSLSGLLAVFALGASILPDAISGTPLVALVAYLVVQGVGLALALLRLTGGDYARALLVGEYARRASEKDWKEKAGEDVIPLSPEAAAEWLARHRDADQLLVQRVHALVNVGELATARQVLERYPRDTAEQRYGHASDTWFLDFLEGCDVEPHGLDPLAAEIEDAEARLKAATAIAVLRGYLAASRGGDWVPPMAAAHPALAGRIQDEWRARSILRTWVMTMAITAAIGGLALLLWRSLEMWSA